MSVANHYQFDKGDSLPTSGRIQTAVDALRIERKTSRSYITALIFLCRTSAFGGNGVNTRVWTGKKTHIKNYVRFKI